MVREHSREKQGAEFGGLFPVYSGKKRSRSGSAPDATETHGDDAAEPAQSGTLLAQKGHLTPRVRTDVESTMDPVPRRRPNSWKFLFVQLTLPLSDSQWISARNYPSTSK